MIKILKKTILYLSKHGIKRTIKIILGILFGKLYKNIVFVTKEYPKLEKHYNAVCKKLKEKIKIKQKISVAFIVIYDASFYAKRIFEKMLNDDIFDSSIIIAPDITRGEENMYYQLDKSYQTYTALYGKRVLRGYVKENDQYIDYSDSFDIFYFSNPYDDMTHTFFQVNYIKTKNALTFNMEYGHVGTLNYTLQVLNIQTISLFWKIFTESCISYDVYRKNQIIKGKNVVISGFYNSDEYSKIKRTVHKQKRIIIAPHHTIGKEFKNTLELSNFLEYADFFLELPRIYTDIDFIFRPHPLLVPRLKKDDIWGVEKTDSWLDDLLANRNVTYSKGGDFYELFVNSDAMIHDCGSFLLEYLFTGYPCCYMLKKNSPLKKEFTKFGIVCLNQYYQAFEKNDIINFIDNVVLKGNDPLKTKREKFAKKYLYQNHSTSERIIDEIKKAIINVK